LDPERIVGKKRGVKIVRMENRKSARLAVAGMRRQREKRDHEKRAGKSDHSENPWSFRKKSRLPSDIMEDGISRY
jgi:hypothetical protein